MDQTTIIEATARAIIDAEFAWWERESADDAAHIPRMRRIAQVAGDAAVAADAGEAGAAALVQRLLRHAEDEYMKRWMADLEPGEDPERLRREGVRTFRRVAGGGFRLRVCLRRYPEPCFPEGGAAPNVLPRKTLAPTEGSRSNHEGAGSKLGSRPRCGRE